MEDIDNTLQFASSAADANDSCEDIIIKAIGVGGGGNNAVDHMYKLGNKHVNFVNINTDRQTLRNSVVPEKLCIGSGLGAGNKPEVARGAAEESEEEIARLFQDGTQMVFITAGMGGGTGTGAAPVVARIAKEHNMLTVGIVTIPFLFEGKKKIIKALEGADEMAKYVDALLVINNQRLTEIYPTLNFMSGFAKADDTLSTAAYAISELITANGVINLDFRDVESTLRDGGAAIISMGYGEGDHRVTKAIQDALESPLLKNRDIMSSQKLLFNLYFSPTAQDEFKMSEVDELKDFISSIDKGTVDVIWGVCYDESLGDKVKITILAAGFEMSLNEDVEQTAVAKSKPVSQPAPQAAGRAAAIDFGTPKPAAPEPSKNYDDIYKGLYNDDKERYIVLTPEQMDDEGVINYLADNPTKKRDINAVKALRSQGVTPRMPSPSLTATGGGSRIEF